jgi:hypothetical protein
MHYLGETTFDGRKCWALKVVRKSGNEEINYYDAASYLLAGTVEHSAAAETWVVTTYRDYQAVGGFKFPTRIDCRRRWNHFVIRLSSIEVNTVEDSAFKMPSGSRANYNSASKR